MTDINHPHGGQRVLHAGTPLQDAEKALILLHGRGASAADIIRLGDTLTAHDDSSIAFLAPQAANSTWYPVSGFLPQDQLAPWLESALRVIDDLIDSVVETGVPNNKIILGGFSQGAMLSLEYASQGRRKVGGVIGFSGSLIGPANEPHAPLADTTHLRIFIGCGTNDSWIPVSAAERTARLFTEAGATVDYRVYEGMEHIINQDEVEGASALIASI